MNREGTLHIVWLNRGQAGLPQYNIGFTDYVSSGGAMKMRQINGEQELRIFLADIDVDQRIIQSTFENLRVEGSTSVLRVVLPDETLVNLGLKEPFRTGKDKVEGAISALKRQGHSVQPVIRDDGTMWFEVDRQVLVAWKEMQDLGDGLYSYEGLLQIYKAVLPVRFTVFLEPSGPVLAYSPAGAYESASFSSKAGTRYESVESLIKALNKAGLPGKEIVEMRVPAKVYTLTGAQLLHLNLRVQSIR